MKVSRRTPLTEMTEDSLIAKLGGLFEAVVEETGHERFAVDRQMVRFAQLGARVTFDSEKLDFDLPAVKDAPEVIKKKFFAYLETEHFDVVERAREAIRDIDAPLDPVTAPVAPEGDDDDTKN